MRKMFYLLFTVVCSFFISNTFAQSDIYIKAFAYDNTKLLGNSTAVGHLNDIEALAYSVGVSTCSGPSPCPGIISDYSFIMVLSPGYVTAAKMVLKGEHLKKVDVYYRKSQASFDYYNIYMEDVTITSVQESGSSEAPTISMSFNAQRIAWQYTAQKSDGSVGTKTKTGWDFGTNTEWNHTFP